MKGKATLILTDKYTKKPVKQIVEHNLVTKALEKIIYPPPIVGITAGTANFADSFFPICNKLIGGIVLLGNNLPENADNFMIPPDIIPIGAAGKAYTGTNPYRGSYNSSVSGPIENGYRMVWDFAPEKANGVIKCIGLTNFCYGNSAFSKTSDQNCGLLVSPVSMGQNLTSTVLVTSVEGYFYGKTEGVRLYSYKNRSGGITLYESEISDPLKVKISDSIDDFKTAKVISEKDVALPVNLTTNASNFYFRDDGCLYFLMYSSTSASYRFNLMKVDLEVGEMTDQLEFSLPYDKGYSSFSFALKKDRIYLAGSGSNATLFTLDGKGENILHTRKLTSGGIYDLYEWNGYIMGIEYLSGYYYRFFAEYDNYPMLYSALAYESASDLAAPPYSLRYDPSSSRTSLYLMIRTDYLATINNLSTPLEKTDRHALQIRYELTY